MRGEREGKAQRGGELGAEQARAEDPDLDVGAGAGEGAHPLARLRLAEVAEQLDDVLGKAVGVAHQRAAERVGGRRVGPGRAPEPEVDPPGVERVERAELLGDDQRRVVGEHDPARADADRRRAGGDVSDRNRGRGAGDAGHVVVLGEPEAAVAPALGVPREVDGVARERRAASPPSTMGARSRTESGTTAANDSSRQARRWSRPRQRCPALNARGRRVARNRP